MINKIILIFSLCLLANSCSFNNQQAQNSQAVLPVANNSQTNAKTSPSTGQTKKNPVTAPANKSSNNTSTSKTVIDPSPAPNPLPVNLINMKIITPEGENNFTVELKDGQNVCDNLYKAKAENKIKSLTIKDAYLESMGSLYVYEINGYKNNWILSLNGKSSSVGCSKVFPKAGDVVEWKFN